MFRLSDETCLSKENNPMLRYQDPADPAPPGGNHENSADIIARNIRGGTEIRSWEFSSPGIHSRVQETFIPGVHSGIKKSYALDTSISGVYSKTQDTSIPGVYNRTQDASIQGVYSRTQDTSIPGVFNRTQDTSIPGVYSRTQDTSIPGGHLEDLEKIRRSRTVEYLSSRENIDAQSQVISTRDSNPGSLISNPGSLISNPGSLISNPGSLISLPVSVSSRSGADNINPSLSAETMSFSGTGSRSGSIGNKSINQSKYGAMSRSLSYSSKQTDL